MWVAICRSSSSVGVVPRRYHVAVAHQGCRLRRDRLREQQRLVRVRLDARVQFAQQRRIERHQRPLKLRQHGEGAAQLSEVARPRRAQRHPGEDALHVADV